MLLKVLCTCLPAEGRVHSTWYFVLSTYIEGELDRESNMQKMHIANSDKPVANTI